MYTIYGYTSKLQESTVTSCQREWDLAVHMQQAPCNHAIHYSSRLAYVTKWRSTVATPVEGVDNHCYPYI